MARALYKTAQGQLIDFDSLRLNNENTVAVGNHRVNARGDEVTRDGTVIKSKQSALKERRQEIENLVTYKPKSAKG